MATTASVLAAVAAAMGAGYFIDPRVLSRNSVQATKIARDGLLSSDATFWTGHAAAIDRVPGTVQDDTNWTADTYKTLVNLSGQSGLISQFIGPTLPTAADTNTWRITRDGTTAVEITMTAQANANRCVLGELIRVGTSPATDIVSSSSGASSDGLTFYADPITSSILFSPRELKLFGSGLLFRFNTSILVEAKISVSLSTTAAQERRSGVMLQRTS